MSALLQSMIDICRSQQSAIVEWLSADERLVAEIASNNRRYLEDSIQGQGIDDGIIQFVVDTVDAYLAIDDFPARIRVRLLALWIDLLDSPELLSADEVTLTLFGHGLYALMLWTKGAYPPGSDWVPTPESSEPTGPAILPIRMPTTSAQRERIKRRDGYRCRYCRGVGTKNRGPDGEVWHIDHVVPVALGGSNTEENKALACQTCNLKKGTKEQQPTPLKWHQRCIWKLDRKPQ